VARQSRKPTAVVAARLARTAETPVAPAWLVRAATGTPRPSDGREKSFPAIQALEDEARAVRALAAALGALEPAWPADPEFILL